MLMPSTARRLHGERGTTLTEVLVASMLTVMIAAVFLTLFSAFSRNVQVEQQRAEALRDIRPVIAQMLVELRQAVDVDNDGAIIASLDSSWGGLDVVFHSDRRDDMAGPEKYHYYIANCSGGLCDLMHETTPADAGSGPNWTYVIGPSITRVLVTNVVASGNPLFEGISWATGSEVVTTSCDATARCVFEVVKIDLRIDPDPNNATLPEVQILEAVRLRNGQRI